MDLIVTDPSGKPIACHDAYTLDLAYGSDENDFELALPPNATRLGTGSLIWMDGTGIGGIVDQTVDSVTGGVGTITYKGRDWHGILDSRILEPDAGMDYLTISGPIPTVITSLITRAGLGSLFSADHDTSPDVTVKNWQVDRYCTLYEGLSKLLRANGLKLTFHASDAGVAIAAPPIETYGDVDSDLLDFTSTSDGRPVNHLICLGKGELKDRIVVHWYADADGKISHTKTLTGTAERTAVYEYSNAQKTELEIKGKEKLQDLQQLSTVSVDIHDGFDADVGDIVTGRDNSTGLTVTAEITKKTVKASKGVTTITVEAGNTGSGSMSSTAETSNTGGGATGTGIAYTAGQGIRITGTTISADVTQTDLQAIQKTATDAATLASNYSNEIGKAQQTANQSQQTVQTLQTTIDTIQTNIDTLRSQAITGDERSKLAGIEENANAYTLPVASASTIGGVKVDDATVKVRADGTLYAVPQSGAAGSFLAAHPVDSLYWTTATSDPAAVYGGTWKELDTMLGGHVWQRLS